MTNPLPQGRIDGMLHALWRAGGTDLLLTTGLPPKIRVHGKLRSLAGYEPLAPEAIATLLTEVFTGDQGKHWARTHEYDFSFDWRDQARIRGNAFRQRGHTAVALRMIPRTVPNPAELGLPPLLSSFARMHQGLVLVTGPTGSGKSTTIASLIDQINTERACHIITVEDPIEFIHDHKQSVISQREVGVDTNCFGDALRAILREDPDVLLVGEMRDLESIQFALTIAETGHLVFATLHTNDTAQALSRIVDVFPGDQQTQIRTQLAACFTGIAYQRLIPRVGGGLVSAIEVMSSTPAVRNLIKDGKTHMLRNALVTGQNEGMVTLEQSLSLLVQQGLIKYEDAVARSLHPHEIERFVPARFEVAR